MSIRLYDEFAGVGGTSHGADHVPDVEVHAAANHDRAAIESHSANFPGAKHFLEDVTKLEMERMPYAELFSASPACPAWTDANGVRRDFDQVNRDQGELFAHPDDDDPKKAKRKAEYRRSRLLMHEVIRYLRGMQELRGVPVLAGMVENVIQCRLWSEWDAWIGEFRKLGYEVRIIAFNSMHARPVRARRAPQSRDRLFVAYWHRSLKRRPDFDKWLRPEAYCAGCDRTVSAVQVFKKPGADMGRYGAQYVYRCPTLTCGREVVPPVMPALAIIDPTVPGVRIGDRERLGMEDLKPATLERIRAGIARYWLPLLTPAGGTWRKHATPLTQPMPARTTRETDGIAVPPLLVPVEGRPGKQAVPADQPLRTQTTRLETGAAMPMLPFITPLRGGGDKGRARPITDPLTTVTASGNHHGLALPPLVTRHNTGHPESRTTPATEPMRTVTAEGKQSVMWASQLLVPYYGGSNSAVPAAGPMGTLTTRDRYGIASHDLADAADAVDLDDVLFRMLEPHEVGAAMAFDPEYRLVAKAKKTRVRLYGNAVTPPVAEVIFSALVEAITGEDLPREFALAA